MSSIMMGVEKRVGVEERVEERLGLVFAATRFHSSDYSKLFVMTAKYLTVLTIQIKNYGILDLWFLNDKTVYRF